jgi:hypothetical protein
MSEDPNNQNQPNGNEDARQIYTLIGKILYNFLSSPTMLNFLRAQPILGNTVLFFLTSLAGYSAFEKFHPRIVDASTMCEQAKVQVASQLRIDSSKIIVFSAATNPSNEKQNQLLSCEYKIQENSQSELGNLHPSTKKYYIVYQIVRDEFFVVPIKEEKITQENLALPDLR